jgi:hypothetical protein
VCCVCCLFNKRNTQQSGIRRAANPERRHLGRSINMSKRKKQPYARRDDDDEDDDLPKPPPKGKREAVLIEQFDAGNAVHPEVEMHKIALVRPADVAPLITRRALRIVNLADDDAWDRPPTNGRVAMVTQAPRPILLRLPLISAYLFYEPEQRSCPQQPRFRPFSEEDVDAVWIV